MALRVDYFLGETFSNLRRNLLMTLAAVSTVSVSLFLLGGTMIFGHIVNNVVGRWEGKVELNVFLRDEITPDQNKQLGDDVAAMPEVSKVTYVSKESAYQEYKDMFKDSPQLYENVDQNALPASYRIKLRDPKAVDAVRTRIEGRPGVDEVNYGGDAVRRLLRINSLLRTISLAFTLILLAAATLLIANTIRLAVYARRKEIGIMKLVGATNWFIRVPFIFEGIVEAGLGALGATAIIYAGKIFVLDQLQRQVVFVPITIASGVVLQVFVILLAIGIGIGAAGSTLALRRFLEV
jgi:cell division transport system permease protein